VNPYGDRGGGEQISYLRPDLMTQRQVGSRPDFIRQHPDGWVIRIVAAPRAKRSAFLGFHGGVPRVAVAAPPTDGLANEELVRFMAAFLGVPKQSIQLLRGDSSKYKSLLIRATSGELVIGTFLRSE
jgi:uncharacterized protein (TIGR00251 family)